MVRVLVVAAHPDDETFGAGGTIVRHAQQGDEVCVLFLTEGVSARHGKKAMQEKAARKACAALGVPQVRFAGLPDQRLDQLPLLEVIRPIQEVCAELQPHVLYTHHRGDVNQDHRAVFAACQVVARPVPGSCLERVLCYEVASSTEWGPSFAESAFVPNAFVDIDATLETKLRAVDAYRETYQSEIRPFPHPRSPEAVKAYARSRGISVGLRAAEAFVLVREVVGEGVTLSRAPLDARAQAGRRAKITKIAPRRGD
jgi:LmbE family N-acetylglucosaminyl deacetylase